MKRHTSDRERGNGTARLLTKALATPVFALLVFLATSAMGQGVLPFERTEERAPCKDFTAQRRPYFGDLHVHSSYSFDSYVSSQRNDPWNAYRYAKGEPITVANADGQQEVVARLRRPLDFTAVTDHAEFLGEVNACTGEGGSLAWLWPHCVMTRSDIFIVQLLAGNWWAHLGVTGEDDVKGRSALCSLPGVDCEANLTEFWGNIQRAAEEHYDRSAECSFTTFVGYEYTDAPGFKNLHRNVIFRNERVTATPISTYDTGSRNVPELWRRLRAECIEGDRGCDVLAIPHNSNLSGGLMFPDPANREEAEDRRFFEPLVELVQHKASSECRFDRLSGLGVDTADELCTFEQNRTDNLSSLGMLHGKMRAKSGKPVAIADFGRRNMMRNVLKDGMALEKPLGINPFKMGFIGSTDTHTATPGAADEDDFVGHLGRRDSEYRNVQDHFEDNPGGLAVVYAEENSRDALFEGMRRRETYATSGTRPTVRVFAGWEFEPEICRAEALVEAGYAGGVPMGGDLPPGPAGGSPRILISAMKDPGVGDRPGVDLQRLQVIKGWVDGAGVTHERVYDVAGSADNGASVDPDTCAPRGRGAAQLCSVFEDPDFDPALPAFYYVRVLENPTCRWSTLQCQAAGVNPFDDECQSQADEATRAAQARGATGDVYGRCCLAEEDEPFYSPVIQERAWTSPIWYQPG